MPLLNFYLTPDLAAVHFQLLCREYNITHYYADPITHRVLKVKGSDHNDKLVAPFYLYGRKALSVPNIVSALRKLVKTDNLVALICDVHLVVNGVPIKTVPIRTGADLFNLLDQSIGNDAPTDFSLETGSTIRTSTTSIGSDVAKACMGNSVMHMVQTMLYRVPPVDRDKVKTAMMGYLAGNEPSFGVAGQYPAVMGLFTDDSIMRLRFASQYAQKHGIEQAVKKYEVDAFDLRYLRATTSEKPITPPRTSGKPTVRKAKKARSKQEHETQKMTIKSKRMFQGQE